MSSAVRPTNIARVTMLMRTNLLMDSLRNNSVDMLKVQNQLTTGLKLARPSDSPGEATTIMHLDDMLERQQQYLKNIDHALNYFATTDTALNTAVELTEEAYNLALGSIGAATDADGRKANAVLITSIIEALVTQANASYDGSYVFAGLNSTEAPFEEFGTGVMFHGNLDEMQTRVSAENLSDFSVTGNDVFGSLSSQVIGIADLDPNITAETLLADLNGATGQGIRRGSITINNDGDSATIDLSNCVTVGDVISKINADGPTGVTAAIDPADEKRLLVSGDASLKILEVGTGNTADDLGIFDDVGAGGTISGQDVDARLSLGTPVTALAGGAGIDTISGLTITNSAMTEVGTINLSSANTLGDILNAINGAGIGVRAEINSQATGINVLNQLSGSRMTISENGGDTAADLGIRSLAGTTSLADLNGGGGVHFQQDADDIAITDGADTSYGINLDGALTVQDVIDKINLVAGATVTATLASVGNGIVLTDTSGGPGDLKVTAGNDTSGYFTAQELGLENPDNPSTGAVLTGADVNPIMPDGLFSHLLALRDALNANDNNAISDAAAALENDRQTLSNIRGAVGSQARALEGRQTHLEDTVIATETLRSDIRDVDFAEAITRYQNLYTALQANLMTGSQLTNTSLLDFLG